MTTTFSTGNPIGSTKAKDLSDNASNFDDASLLLSDTWVDRLGVTRDTINGRIKKMGFAVPIAYTSGILFTTNDNVKTVIEGGVIYAPLVDELPFTTTNFAADAAKFYTVQGLNDLAIVGVNNRYNPETIQVAIDSTEWGVNGGEVFRVQDREAGKGGAAFWETIIAGVTDGVDKPNGDDILQCVGIPNLAIKLYKNKNLDSTSYADGTAGAKANAAISSLHKAGDSDTGGIVSLSDTAQALGETIVIDNTIQTFSVDGVKLQGYGRQTSDFDATGLQDGVQMVYPIYTEIRDFGIANASRYNIWIDDITSNAGNRNRIQGIKANFAGVNNFEFSRCYLTTLESCEARGAGNNGFHWDTEVHTSWNIANNYAWYNTAAGFNIGRAVYTHLNANASDFNQHGYQFSNSRGVVSTACGAEFNTRAGWIYYSGGVNTIRNHCVGTGLLANDNNTSNNGFANHTHLIATDSVLNYVYLNQPVSLDSVNHQATTYDFEASGRGAVLTINDPVMSNQKTRARNGAYIQENYTSPTLVFEKAFTATQTQKVINIRSVLDTSDYSGMLQVTAHNSEPGTIGAIGTATYLLMISKSLNGLECIEITKAGMTTGAAASHPSFIFTLATGELDATAISQTAGTFHFVIEKLSGSFGF